jgi:hypothetical protein
VTHFLNDGVKSLFGFFGLCGGRGETYGSRYRVFFAFSASLTAAW